MISDPIDLISLFYYDNDYQFDIFAPRKENVAGFTKFGLGGLPKDTYWSIRMEIPELNINQTKPFFRDIELITPTVGGI